ncbi:MAG: MATE family efflux transporter [Bacilli bacterium]
MNLDLGNEKIGKLIKKFSIPCVISMIVAALYNIVDQIFIGWSSAGAAGNAATNIVYPFTVIALSLALLIGDGATALFSLSLGADDKKKANKSIGNGLVFLIVLAILLTFLGLIFQNQILAIFGGNPDEVLCYQYAKDYFKIICLGIPFYIIGQGLNSAIRADGSPKIAMAATMIGAITNIILDPIFIFVFKMNVKGAAIATIIGQIFTFLISIWYLTRSKSFKISKDSIKINSSIIKKILSLGLASFITQIAIVIIISVANNLVSKYGYETLASTGEVFGAVTPLAVIGICLKVFGIIVSIVIGISLGGQPIIGYNMGAGKIERVKETCKKILTINLIVGLIAFILFEFCPNLIISIFGSHNSIEYLEYANLCMRIYLGGIILTCFIKSTSICLQSMGSSIKSTLLALSRDVIFFVPAIIIVTTLSHSIVTMLWSAIVADILAFILAIILLKQEFKKLGSFELNDTNNVVEENNNLKNILNKKIVITISREYGSGGRYVAKLLSEILGIKFYDKEIIDLVSKESGMSTSYIENSEQKKKNIGGNFYNNDDELFNAEMKVIKKLYRESCVIVGRCSDYILKDKKDVFKVFLYSNDIDKVNRVVKYYGIDKDNALKEINKINKLREKHYNYYTGRKWRDFDNYDLVINVDTLGVEKTAEVIKKAVIEKLNK